MLLALRRELAVTAPYDASIRYADEAEKRGKLAGLYQRVARLAEAVAETPEGPALRVSVVKDDLEAAYLRWVTRRFEHLDLFRRDEHDPLAKPVDLSSVYIALDTHERRTWKVTQQRQQAGGQVETKEVERVEPVSALRAAVERSRIVLLGEPGSGKSTFAQHLCLCLANARLGMEGWAERLTAGPKDDPDRWVAPFPLPVFIRLRFFANDVESLPDDAQTGQAHQLLHFIRKELERDDVGLGDYMPGLRGALNDGEVLLVLDGLDEVTHPQPDEKDPTFSDVLRRVKVVEAIRDFARIYPQVRLLVTCRFGVYQQSDSPHPEHNWRLNGFSLSVLQDFDSGQIRNFVNHWFTEMRRCNRLPGDPADFTQSLLSALSTREQLDELARKPILLTQMTLLHVTKRLPDRRVELYRDCADLLLWKWESLKAAQTERGESADLFIKKLGVPNLNREALEQALGRAVFDAHRAGLPHVPEAELEARLVEVICQRYPHCSEPFAKGKAAEFIAGWLRGRNGLFQWTGARAFDFPHRSFREFLAGRHLMAYGDPQAADEDWFETAPRLARADPANWGEVIRFAAACDSQDRNPKNVVAALEEICPEAHVPAPDETPLTLLAARIIASDVGQDSVSKVRALKRGDAVCQRLEPQLLHLLRDTSDSQPYPNDPPRHTSINALAPQTRLEAGLLLDALGWTPPDLFDFIVIDAQKAEGSKQKAASRLPLSAFWVSKFPVTNLHYKRFLDSDDYADEALWRSITAFDLKGRPQPEMGAEAWEWFQKSGGKDHKPSYWNNPRFGEKRRLLPVVTVTWYEAAAYCAWLTRRWREGDESVAEVKALKASGHRSFVFRLPLEDEWQTAAGGVWEPDVEPKTPRYPWQAAPGVMTDEEIQKNTNTGASNFNATSPVCMFPSGASYKHGVMDMSGNVWEWQANLYVSDSSHRALRGGSWVDRREHAQVGVRNRNVPVVGLDNLGLRVVASPG